MIGQTLTEVSIYIERSTNEIFLQVLSFPDARVQYSGWLCVSSSSKVSRPLAEGKSLCLVIHLVKASILWDAFGCDLALNQFKVDGSTLPLLLLLIWLSLLRVLPLLLFENLPIYQYYIVSLFSSLFLYLYQYNFFSTAIFTFDTHTHTLMLLLVIHSVCLLMSLYCPIAQ